MNRETALREIARCFLAGAGHDDSRRAGARDGPVAARSRARQPRVGRGRIRDDARAWRVSVGRKPRTLTPCVATRAHGRLYYTAVRKAAAGLLIGVCAAGIVLALDQPRGVPDRRAEDLRLAARSHGRSFDRTQRHRARRNRRVFASKSAAACGQMAMAPRRACEPHRLSQSRQAEADCV